MRVAPHPSPPQGAALVSRGAWLASPAPPPCTHAASHRCRDTGCRVGGDTRGWHPWCATRRSERGRCSPCHCRWRYLTCRYLPHVPPDHSAAEAQWCDHASNTHKLTSHAPTCSAQAPLVKHQSRSVKATAVCSLEEESSPPLALANIPLSGWGKKKCVAHFRKTHHPSIISLASC